MCSSWSQRFLPRCVLGASPQLLELLLNCLCPWLAVGLGPHPMDVHGKKESALFLASLFFNAPPKKTNKQKTQSKQKKRKSCHPHERFLEGPTSAPGPRPEALGGDESSGAVPAGDVLLQRLEGDQHLKSAPRGPSRRLGFQRLQRGVFSFCFSLFLFFCCAGGEVTWVWCGSKMKDLGFCRS